MVVTSSSVIQPDIYNKKILLYSLSKHPSVDVFRQTLTPLLHGNVAFYFSLCNRNKLGIHLYFVQTKSIIYYSFKQWAKIFDADLTSLFKFFSQQFANICEKIELFFLQKIVIVNFHL